MESDEDSRSSSNSSGSSNSTSNSPAQENENESNDQTEQVNSITQRSRSSSQDSNSLQGKQDSNHENQSMSPSIREEEPAEQQQQQRPTRDDEDEELELSDIDEESSNNQKKPEISHEDLSDISDLDDSNGPASPSYSFTDLRQKLDKRRQNGSSGTLDSNKNDEDELDFEADEVKDVAESAKKTVESKQKDTDNGNGSVKEDGEHKSDNELESGEELEDGEVTDGDEKRPEESEPKAVCRFFTRGQCTWGMSCRFLHPGTTDKGNYTMFDLVRPIPVPQAAPPMMMPSYDYRNERPIHHMPPHFGPRGGGPPPPASAESESAWERGLRTAKEMMRKANKRKEQDMDFDEKKMNLSGPPDEVERDPYYARGSPEVRDESHTI
jgi:nuclear protein NHN1